MEEFAYQGTDILAVIRTVVENNPEIYGVTIAFEPHAYSTNARTFAPYYFKQNGKWNLPISLTTTSPRIGIRSPENYTRQYVRALFRRSSRGIMMAAFSVPFTDGFPENACWPDCHRGYLARLAEGDHCFYQDRPDRLRLSHLEERRNYHASDSRLVMNETIFMVAEDRGDQEMREWGGA